jgi:hypothetical protein
MEAVMALPSTITRPEDVPEIARDHYAQKEGVWTLTLLNPEEHAGLVSALTKERTARRDVETQFSALKTKFEGIDPEEVAQLKTTVASYADKEVYDKHGLEELVGRRTHEMKTAHERQLALKDRELATEKEARAALDHQWRRDRIETALLSAISEAGIDKMAVEDAVARGQKVFTDLDEQGQAVAKTGEEIRYGKDGVTPLTPKEFFLTLKSTGQAPHLWPASSGSGAQQGRGTGNNGVDYAQYTSPTERLTRWRQDHVARG